MTGWNPASGVPLAAANARRAAGARERYELVAAARAARPELSWPKLAAEIGMTKPVAYGYWRRLQATRQREGAR